MSDLSPNGLITSLLKDWESAVGKMILSVTEERDHRIFRFTDGTALMFSRNMESGGWETEAVELNFRWPSDQQIGVYFGLFPQEEYERQQAIYEAKYERDRELQERKAYERLKAKYAT